MTLPTGPLYSRLRAVPSRSTVLDSLPVLFFGDDAEPGAATVALNPSAHEYMSASSPTSPAGALLTGSSQRFATLESLGAKDRLTLSDSQCAHAVQWMRDYFKHRENVYGYFSHLEHFLDGAGYAFDNGSAIHLDLVQESTSPMWRGLPEDEKRDLLTRDLPFLQWELSALPLHVLFCNGRTVSDIVRAKLGVAEIKEGLTGKLAWWIGSTTTARGRVALAGWNIPLNQATRLNVEGERNFGRFLATELQLAQHTSD